MTGHDESIAKSVTPGYPGTSVLPYSGDIEGLNGIVTVQPAGRGRRRARGRKDLVTMPVGEEEVVDSSEELLQLIARQDEQVVVEAETRAGPR